MAEAFQSPKLEVRFLKRDADFNYNWHSFEDLKNALLREFDHVKLDVCEKPDGVELVITVRYGNRPIWSTTLIDTIHEIPQGLIRDLISDLQRSIKELEAKNEQ